MATETLGASFSIDITNLKAGLTQANKMIRESESEFRAAAAGLDDWTSSEEGLTAKIKQLNNTTDLQKTKVEALQKNYNELIARGLDPASKQAVELRTQINNETAALRKNESELKKQEKALAELGTETKDTAEATDEMGESFSGLKAVAGVAVGAIAAVGAACVGAVTAFFGLAESTREYRQEMAQLAQNAKDSGADLDSVKDKLAEVSAVTGEADAAMEGMNMLMATGLDTSQIEIASDALAGAATRFDGLKFEGMAEGLQETLATGVAVGPFAELIERTGGDLEKFNKGLAACTTEAEKQAYTMQFLTESGLVEANAEYKEMNKDLYDAEMAQYNLNDALAELGAIAEPILTTLKTLAADLLTSITPFVSLIGEGLTGALNGTAGATDMLAEGLSGVLTTLVTNISEMLPVAIETLISVISTIVPQAVSTLSEQLPVILDLILGLIPDLVSSILSQLPLILEMLISGISQIASMLGEMLPTLIPIIIQAVLNLVETLLDNIDLLIDAGIQLIMGLADGLLEALPLLIDKIPVIIDKLISAITRNLPKLIEMGIQLTVKLAAGIIQAIPQLLSKIPQIISSIVSGLSEGIGDIMGIGEDIIRGLWDGISNMASWIGEKIQGFGESVLGGIKDFFGIASPSKLMADEVGKNLALGIGEGFTKNIGAVNDEITEAMEFDTPNYPTGGRPQGVGGRGGVVVYQTNNYSQTHSRYELYKTKQQTAAAVRLALGGA